MSPAIAARCLDQALDFAWRQVVTRLAGSDCYISRRWSGNRQVRICHGFLPVKRDHCYTFLQKRNSRPSTRVLQVAMATNVAVSFSVRVTVIVEAAGTELRQTPRGCRGTQGKRGSPPGTPAGGRAVGGLGRRVAMGSHPPLGTNKTTVLSHCFAKLLNHLAFSAGRSLELVGFGSTKFAALTAASVRLRAPSARKRPDV